MPNETVYYFIKTTDLPIIKTDISFLKFLKIYLSINYKNTNINYLKK